MQTILDRAGTNRVIVLHKHMISKICAAVLLCSGGGAWAQAIYKQIDATGRTTFTDRPESARVVVSYEIFPSEERGSVSPPRIATGTRSDVEQALFMHTAMRSTYAATVDLNEAARRLRQARQSLEDGIQPRPGERVDSAGTSAMDRRYQRRQQKLEREVVAAVRRSHETSLVQSALVKRDGKADPVRLARNLDRPLHTALENYVDPASGMVRR